MHPKCVVVGAGPVGALAALYAARRGWDVEIYDLRSGRIGSRKAALLRPIPLTLYRSAT